MASREEILANFQVSLYFMLHWIEGFEPSSLNFSVLKPRTLQNVLNNATADCFIETKEFEFQT